MIRRELVFLLRFPSELCRGSPEALIIPCPSPGALRERGPLFSKNAFHLARDR